MPSIFFKHAHWLFIVLLSLGQLQRLQLNIFGVTMPVYIHELYIVMFLGWFYSSRLNSKRLSQISLSKTFKHVVSTFNTFALRYRAVFLLICWALGGMIIHTLIEPQLAPWLYLLRLSIYLWFSLTLKSLFAPELDALRERYVIGGIVIALVGLIQYTILPDTRFLSAFGWDDHYYRLISTLFDPNFTGLILVLSWVYAASLAWLQRYPKLRLGILVGLSVALGLTFSRASFLAFAVALSLILWLKKETQIITFSLLIVVASVLLAPKPTGEGVNLGRTSTITSRLVVSKHTLSELQGSPQLLLFGNGLFFGSRDSYTRVSDTALQIPNHARWPDNIFLMLLSGIGLIGLALAGASLTSWLKILWHNHPWFLTALVGALVHAQFNNSLLEPFVLLFLIAGATTTGLEPASRNKK